MVAPLARCCAVLPLALVLWAGCLSAQSTVCEDGSICPADKRCSPIGCVDDSCGDGVIDGAEQCEPGNVPLACNELPAPFTQFYSTDAPVCTNQCRFDAQSCESGGFCSNGWRRGTHYIIYYI